MVTKEYAIAYKEVIEILSHVPEEDLAKIPSKKIKFYKENMDMSYNFKVDENIDFKEQKMSQITEAILANIFRDYWATPYQKERIEAKEKYDLEKLEEKKRQMYNLDDIFLNKRKPKTGVEKTKFMDTNKLPIKYKECFYQRLINFIKKIFKF